MSKMGHNNPPSDEIDGVKIAPLVSYIERIERLEVEKKAIADDIKEIFDTAKGNGYDVKAMRHVLKMRKMDEADRAEAEALIDIYMRALGMLADTPLGEAARLRKMGVEVQE